MSDLDAIAELLKPVENKSIQRFVWTYTHSETRTEVYDNANGGRKVASFLNGIIAQQFCTIFNTMHERGENIIAMGTGGDA